LGTASYSRHFKGFDLDANFSAKIPLNDNHLGYTFGNEFRINAAVARAFPSVSFQLKKGVQVQASVPIPVYEDWNGRRTTNVGQVAPEITSQITLVYNGAY
jgi:hypothetical protein